MSEKILFACVAVNYGTTKEAISFAESFALAAAEESAELLLVDNSDGHRTGELGRLLPRSLKKVTCVDGGGNAGYFGGARIGLRILKERGLDPKWVAISNVDLSIDFRAFLKSLAKMDDEGVGVVAPSIRSNISGHDLNPFMETRPTRLRMHGYKWIFRSYPTFLAYQKASDWRRMLSRKSAPTRNAARDEVTRRIYAAHGSFFLLSRAYLSRAGALEHEPFLFGEEISIAESARRFGLSVLYNPTMQLMHAEHASTGTLPSRRSFELYRAAAGFCADRYFAFGDQMPVV